MAGITQAVLYNGTAGYPPAVNASSSRCPRNEQRTRPRAARRNLISSAGRLSSGFDGRPQNQGKVMVHYTDPADPRLFGSMNWTFEPA